MSLVSHDSIWKCHYGVTNEPKNDTLEKNKARSTVPEEEVKARRLEAERKINNNGINIKLAARINVYNYDIIADINNKNNNANNNELKTSKNNTNKGHLSGRSKFNKNEIKRLSYNIFHIEESTVDDTRKKNKNANIIKYKNNSGDKEWNEINNNEIVTLNNVIIKKEDIEKYVKANDKQLVSKNDIENTNKRRASDLDQTIANPKKIWQKQNGHHCLIKNSASNALRGINDKYKRKSRWRINSGVLISLMMLNVTGLSSAEDTPTFTSTLTSRMIATFLGYPSTCSLGNEVRPCTLTLTCWLRGGTRLRGCGGWLFSCCGSPEPSRESFDNSIPSSEWKYKPPSKLRQVPQRSVVPNNVFRRRVDDDVTQMECGLPSSRILQKRIIGGREARFAEFPWQAHVRISEFQCGGVLVSRRYVATAAHCVSRAHTRDIAVWLGAIDTSATHHPARKLGVIQKILHPLFQFRMTQPDRYDIALLKLSHPITYMSHILPICLPDHELELRGRSGVIAGWGKTDASSGHTGTNLLRSATVPILSKEQCINWHQSKQISVEIHSEMICAGHPDGHQDACLGDSGGPLIVLDNGRYYLVGITSAGFGCGVDHQPGIYHNVRLTANWIRSVISPAVNYNDNYLN